MPDSNVSSKSPDNPKGGHRLLFWAVAFVAAFAILLLVANVPELRAFDPVFLPSIFLVLLISLRLGYVIGADRAARRIARRRATE